MSPAERRQITRLRTTGERADIPEGLAELLCLGPSEPSGGVLRELDQDALLPIARLLGPDALNRQALSDLAEAARPMKDNAELVAAAEHFEHLPAHATPTEIDQVASQLATVLEPILARFERSPTGRAIARTPASQRPAPLKTAG